MFSFLDVECRETIRFTATSTVCPTFDREGNRSPWSPSWYVTRLLFSFYHSFFLIFYEPRRKIRITIEEIERGSKEGGGGGGGLRKEKRGEEEPLHNNNNKTHNKLQAAAASAAAAASSKSWGMGILSVLEKLP